MRKIKTKGLKFKVKPVDRGPRFAVALHKVTSPDKLKKALSRVFDVNNALADVVLGKVPVVICRDLPQQTAVEYAKQLKGGGDFRVWAESAATKMKNHMNLKQREGQAPMAAPQIRKH